MTGPRTLLASIATWSAAHGQIALATLFVVCTAVVVWFVLRRPTGDRPSLDAQPLLPGEARWLVARDGTVLDSCVSESETGIATGWAVGQSITTWAPDDTPDAERYRLALEDRQAQTFESRSTGPDSLERVSRIALVPRSDGTVYCESWDMTGPVLRAERAETEAAELRTQRDDLIRFSSDDAVALFEQNAAPTTATP